MADSDGLIPVKLYIKDTDANNEGIFALLKRSGNKYTEVRIYPVETFPPLIIKHSYSH